VSTLQRPQTEEQLLAELQEIGDGDAALADLNLDFGGEPEFTDDDGNPGPRSDFEAEEVPEVDSPLDKD
jgi:hypothetical protein